ncbi:MAG: MTH1187 family thiamine-binding protein [Dethiobacter sp.]|jgi:uncharacterized protein (TIGR00106 family)|nr:MTH1187 family thiamine-binding protein [Dethiobacter sp.]
MAVVDVTVLPIGTGATSLSDFVVACQRELKLCGEGLNFQLTAMGTIIEGDLDRVLEVIRRLHEVPFNHGAMRVSTTIKIDDRRDKAGTILQKIQSVECKM